MNMFYRCVFCKEPQGEHFDGMYCKICNVDIALDTEALIEENQQMKKALEYFAKEMLSTEPGFHKSRPIDLSVRDKWIQEARKWTQKYD